MNQEGLILDLGCGFKPEVGQRSIPGSVGFDLNFEHGKAMVDHPVLASVCYLPVRDKVAGFVNASAILEHLPETGKCLRDMRRVLRENGNGFILIPKDSRQIPQTLKRFLTEFPFTLHRVVKTLINASTFWKLPGVPHITQVNLSDVRKYFKITRLQSRRYVHAWFHWGPFKLLRKLGLVKHDVFIETYSEWMIWFTTV